MTRGDDTGEGGNVTVVSFLSIESSAFREKVFFPVFLLNARERPDSDFSSVSRDRNAHVTLLGGSRVNGDVGERYRERMGNHSEIMVSLIRAG